MTSIEVVHIYHALHRTYDGLMKLSRKSDYALQALFGLIASDGKTPVSIRELAEKYDVPKRFLEQIMLELKSKGWVRSAAATVMAVEKNTALSICKALMRMSRSRSVHGDDVAHDEFRRRVGRL